MLRRNPLLLYVTLPGLAIGLSVVLLLLVYLRYEFSFDQHFSTKDRVLRLYNKVTDNQQTINFGISLRKSYTEIPSKVPEVEAAVQIYRGWTITVKRDDRQLQDLRMLYADPGFFDVFGLSLLYGDKKTALEGTRNIVLTSSAAKKIFGRLDCLGEVVHSNNEPHIVTGVVDDLPKTTHFTFDILASMQTIRPERFGGLELFTYFLIDRNADCAEAGKKIASANDELMQPWLEFLNGHTESGTEYLKDLHMHSVVDGDLSEKASTTNIRIVAGIAFFILIIAMVNFINMYVLHGEKRIAEIAARKSMGATRYTLAKMFYTETGIIAIMALILALAVTVVVQPFFANLMQRPVDNADLFSASGIVIIIAVLIILILISGAYPSFYLSGVNLLSGLKGKTGKVKRKSRLNAAAVMVQFTIMVFLISSIIIMYVQTGYMKKIPLGFEPNDVAAITNFSPEINNNFRSIQEELAGLPFVEAVAFSGHRMGGGCSGQGIKKYGAAGKYLSVNEYRVQPGFAETLQLQLKNGRYFRDGEQDMKSVVLNEAAARMLGLNEPVGTRVDMFEEPMTVIGLVNDFYYENHAGSPIEPLVLTNYSSRASTAYLRISGEFTPERQLQVAKVFKEYDPSFIFTYYSLSENFEAKFKNEERVVKLVLSGTLIAILIGFTGLMALSVFNINRRTREIGIRKAFGSNEAEVMTALLREMFILVFIAMVIAFMGNYILMSDWLTGYANRISLHAGYFLLSGLFALVIALMSAGWQSWKAATRNPVEALRYE